MPEAQARFPMGFASPKRICQPYVSGVKWLVTWSQRMPPKSGYRFSDKVMRQ